MAEERTLQLSATGSRRWPGGVCMPDSTRTVLMFEDSDHGSLGDCIFFLGAKGTEEGDAQED